MVFVVFLRCLGYSFFRSSSLPRLFVDGLSSVPVIGTYLVIMRHFALSGLL